MANFLSLCQTVGEKSGTIGSGQPTAVNNQYGRLLNVVKFTAEAWRLIQVSRTDWEWMLREWSGNTIVNTSAYTAASFGVVGLSRWAKNSTVFCKASGAANNTKRKLTYVAWRVFRENYEHSYVNASQPVYWSIRPGDNAFVMAPKPDGVYELSGEYYKAVQTLAADGDVPELPDDFHDMIVWRAVWLIHEHDEAPDPAARAERNYNNLLTALLDRELPELGFGGPLA